VSGIEIGCAKHQAVALIVVFTVGIAITDVRCRRLRVLRPRAHEQLAQSRIILGADVRSKREFRIWCRVPYCVPGRGLSGSAVGLSAARLLAHQIRARFEAVGSLAPAYHAEIGAVPARPLTRVSAQTKIPVLERTFGAYGLDG
jgi:hypothetical protein